MLGKPWNKKQLKLLRKLYSETKTENLVPLIGRKIDSIYNKAQQLGLKKSEEFLKSEASGRISKLTDAGRLCRFKKGHEPWNKGKKGIHLSPSTQFKKGNEPHNTKHDGAITIRKDNSGTTYKYIRLAKSKWELLHRHLWKQEYGDIPKSHIVTFKDGDTMNCELSNLQLISRAENVVRNHNREKFSKTMKEMWKKEKWRVSYGLSPQTNLRLTRKHKEFVPGINMEPSKHFTL